jgi:ABC-2 type transport system permease protein
MKISNLFAVAGKELQVRAKDRGSLVILFVLPLLFDPQVADEGEEGFAISVYVVNEDRGPYGEQVVKMLRRMPVLSLVALEEAETADQLVGESEKLAAVVIPADFSEKIDAYEQVTVEVIADPLQQQYASIVSGLVNFAVSSATVLGEVQYGVRTVLVESGVLDQADPALRRALVAQTAGAIMTQLQEMQENPAIAVATEDVAGEELVSLSSAFSLIIPGFAVAFAFWLVGVIGAALHAEKDQGTFRRLVAAPISRAEIIGGNVLSHMTIVFLQVVVMFAVGAGVFGMPLGDQPLGLLLVTLALSLAVSAMGLMIGTLARTGKEADTLGLVLGFVLAGLGGAILFQWPPIYRQESVLGFVSRLTPHAHALDGYALLMVDGASVVEALPQVGILLVYAGVFFAVATRRLRFE